MKKVMYLIMLLVLASFVSAFPVLMYDDGVNVSVAKSVVNSLDNRYFEKVDSIYFMATPEEDENSETFYFRQGMTEFWSNNKGYVYSKIYVYQSDKKDYTKTRQILRHELNHHYLYLNDDVRYNNKRWCDGWELL